MQVKTIQYHQTIPTGSYANEKLGVEIDLSEGGTPEEAFKYAKEMIEKIHRENNPHLYPELHSGQRKPAGVSAPIEPTYKSAIELLKEKKDKEIDEYIAAIKQADNLKMLALFQKRINENNDPSNPKHQQLQEAYNDKEQQLKQTL